MLPMPTPFRPLLTLLSLALVASACSPPVEAPEELGELTRYLFANFDTEGEELVAGMDSLEAFLSGVDMGGQLDDRAVTPPKLTSDYWGEVSGPAEVDQELQVPVSVWRESPHPVSSQLGLFIEPNQVCIQDDGTKYYMRLFDSDTSCLVDGTCDRANSTGEVRFENLLAKAWLDTFADLRAVPAADGRVRYVIRGWMEERGIADDGESSWDQRFSLDIAIPHPENSELSWRFLTSWGSVTIPGVGDDLYATLVKSGIDEIFENGDVFIDGGSCDNDRDRPYDRND
ncbi:MAG: hypothetical protein CL928_10045 [Deltaproteobacteria bacterium]|nr:hypothetical protein [Deltaproteobacteria bacterium]